MAQAEMKLKAVTFSKAVRGYSCEEVDTYLAYVNDQYTALAKDCVALRRKMAAQTAGQNEYREDALREKEKIAAEAEAFYQSRKSEADKLTGVARQKAARLLADAETAAAEILRKAEAAAAGILKDAEADAAAIREQKQAAEAEQAAASRTILEYRNTAERMAEEIESFRESVFNMYGKHIEALEQLSRLTDAFYETADTLTEGYVNDEEETDTQEADAAQTEAYAEGEGESYEELYGEEADPEDGEATADDWQSDFLSGEEDEEDSLLRIDWASRSSKAAADENWQDEDLAADELELLLNSAKDDDDLPPEDEDDDILSILPEDDGDGEDSGAVLAAEDGEDDFLSDLASEYLTPKKPDAKSAPAAGKKETKPASKPEDMDDLFGEDNPGGGLTGEFDLIYSSQKSADNVAQIRRQPLVDAQKPQKKKPGKK